MKRTHEQGNLVWHSLINTAKKRSRFFLKHGERFDRRLFAEVDSIVRISLHLRSNDLISSDPEKFKELTEIQSELLRLGQDEYLDFP